jgi:hypothetical protein
MEKQHAVRIANGWTRWISLAAAAVIVSLSAGCTYYADPTAEVVVTSNRDDATVYMVPMDVKIPSPPTEAALKSYAIGVSSGRRSYWLDHGQYWLVLQKDEAWSKPVEFEVRLHYLNKVHVDF